MRILYFNHLVNLINIYHRIYIKLNREFAAEHRRLRVMPSLAQMVTAGLTKADQGESHLPRLLYSCHPIRDRSSDVRQSRWNRWGFVNCDSLDNRIKNILWKWSFLVGYGCLMILSSVPVYFIFVAWKSKPKWFQKKMGKSNILRYMSHSVSSWLRWSIDTPILSVK